MLRSNWRTAGHTHVVSCTSSRAGYIELVKAAHPDIVDVEVIRPQPGHIHIYGGLLMLNMQDVIETDSRKLDQMPAEQRCTSSNTAELIGALDQAQSGAADVLCAWGIHRNQ